MIRPTRPSPLAALFLALALLVPLAAGAAEPLRPPGDDRARARIEALFAEAREALRQGHGGAVLPLLSRASQARLEAVRSAARSGTLAPLDGLGPAEKVAALSLRRFVPAAKLRILHTPELADRALAEGWLAPDTVDRAELGPVTVEGDRAGAPLLVKGRPAPVRASFLREGGQWRIDLIPAVAAADGLLRLFAGVSGQSEDAYARKLAGRLRVPGGKGQTP